MGDHSVNPTSNKSEHNSFIKHLLDDIEALQYMLDHNMMEDDIRRIGSEQEFCLMNQNFRPSDKAELILKKINDPHFTTELAKYNLEINLDPFELTGDCFTQVENQLSTLLSKAGEVAKLEDVKLLLTGILPTITKHELAFNYMTPNPRYWALNNMMRSLRGSDFELKIRGVDELSIKHDSVLFEACNTSFQIHLQIPSHDFVASHNWAQAISGPVLGICTNSPLLLGRELWCETRIALFQQSIDLRSSSHSLKDQRPRVTFGTEWLTGSVVDIFKNDIANYKVILGKAIQKNSIDELQKGNIPKLEALTTNNSTIYRWNRPCYGVGGGKPHLRIENRYIPSGPTQIDELANFAFWIGLMMGRPSNCDDLPAVMDFREVKANFIKSARTGKESVLRWFGKRIAVKDLVLQELLPIAEEGLKKCKIDQADISRLLNIIEKRTKGQTGSQWTVDNYRRLKDELKPDDSLLILTKTMYENQNENKPVHNWEDIVVKSNVNKHAKFVHHIMSRQLFTVNENDPAELAVKVMEWKGIHHIPVENEKREIAGILTWTHMKRFNAQNQSKEDYTVKDIMEKNILFASPTMEIKAAIVLMKKHEVGCLPVISDDHLIGIITIPDLIPFEHD